MAITPIGVGATANDGTGDPFRDAMVKVNANESDLDTRVDAAAAAGVSLAGGATVTDARLKEWTEAGAYEATAISFDADGVVTTATVKWPDGSAGVFTTVTKNTTWLAVDAYTITHTVSGLTVTQAAVTRDADGNVTTKPALTVA